MEITEDVLRKIIRQEVEAVVKQEFINMFRIAKEKSMKKANFVDICTAASIESFLKQIDNSVTAVNSKGFVYVREAINFCIKMNLSLYNLHITKDIYPALAKQFETTHISVERVIRVYIETLWKNGSFQQVAEKLGFGQLDNRPTNTQFITSIANYLKL